MDGSWRDGEGRVWMGVEGTRWAKAWAKSRLVVGGGEASGNWVWLGAQGRGWGWVGASWGVARRCGRRRSELGVQQPAQGLPRLPSPTILSGYNEELFQLKAPGAWPAAAAALASLQQGPGEPLCPLAAWPEVS